MGGKGFILYHLHAIERAKERYGQNVEGTLKLAEKSVTNGYGINDVKSGKVRRYIKKKIKGDRVIYGYKHYLFVFKPFNTKMLLITTFPLPDRLEKYVRG